MGAVGINPDPIQWVVLENQSNLIIQIETAN